MSAAPTRPVGTQARGGRRARISLLVTALVLAAVDLVVKAAAVAALSGGETVDLGPVNLRLYYNPGVAFSLGATLPSWVIIAATGLIIAGLLWYLWSSVSTLSALSRAGGAVLLGGALGNFLDRLDGTGVVDYLHTSWFPTFNLADVFVTTGVIALLLGTMWHPTPDPAPEP
ncbi:signal peptidase II [Micrococcus sp. TA1]|uniref:signal peptidase II n=1 Tax=Micrococcus sp. TA1 TaxID=681627 RepID=UPI001612B191|nr:signal peptidase II [Micrococcus sp. TA1]MBB5748002.1 signal peptidase II [Micrococcus sp. TA1]